MSSLFRRYKETRARLEEIAEQGLVVHIDDEAEEDYDEDELDNIDYADQLTDDLVDLREDVIAFKSDLHHLQNWSEGLEQRFADLAQKITELLPDQPNTGPVVQYVECPCCGHTNMKMINGTIFCSNPECGAHREPYV